ncbi:MAG: hypothetical protein Q9160_007444 [Pyrenula sp. 1 TL-2023]
MSEVQSRPSGPRGRGGFRGGRGGYSSRGGRGVFKGTKSEDLEQDNTAIEDQGELGDLKRKYSNRLPMLRELFQDWTDDDLVFAMKETNGDFEMCVDRITDGTISQWGQVKKKHVDKPKTRTKENQPPATEGVPTGRGGRGRGGMEARGRGRGDRARGGRGGRVANQPNGTRINSTKANTDGPGEAPMAAEPPNSWEATPVTGTSTWDAPTNGDTIASNDWAASDVLTEPLVEEQKKEAASTSKPSSWANLFATKPPVVPKVPAQPLTSETKTIEPTAPKMPSENVIESVESVESLPEPILNIIPTTVAVEPAHESAPADDSLALTPSKDELTETNLEQLPDTSHPPATATAASTVASTHDPHSTLNSTVPQTRPGMSGYAASALKATSGQGRSASFQRRIMDQQEAVVMPGDRAMDRAAVQFGSMGLNADQLDVDEDREEAETRAQPPKESPIAPRASLPPPSSTLQTHAQQQLEAPAEPLPVPRPAPGLPPAPQQPSPVPTTAYTDFARYPQAGHKSYDPFGQQTAQQPAPSQESYPSPNATAPQQPSTTAASSEYANYYSTNQPQRDPYQSYYGAYGPSQESQQRSGSGFGTTSQDVPSGYGTASAQQPSRFQQPDPQSSGASTPNPALQGQQGQSAQQLPQSQGSHAGYPYGYPNANFQYHPQYPYMNQMNHQHQYGRNRPMFDDARRYDDNFAGHNSHYGYGNQYGSYGSKQGMYGQPHQYPYGNSSPADPSLNQSSVGGRDSVYGRTGSTQPADGQPSASNSAFGSLSDTYGRSQSGFGNHSSSQQPLGQHGGSEESAKGYDPAKPGPSPSISQTHRPSSTSMQGQQGQQGGQGGFPPPQSQHSGQQQAFGGYPQYGGLGGLSGHQNQSHQNTGYGYGNNQGFGGNYGYGSTGGRGWGGNYGGH